MGPSTYPPAGLRQDTRSERLLERLSSRPNGGKRGRTCRRGSRKMIARPYDPEPEEQCCGFLRRSRVTSGYPHKRRTPRLTEGFFDGGRYQTRTDDLFRVKEARYQLRQSPVDSRPRIPAARLDTSRRRPPIAHRPRAPRVASCDTPGRRVRFGHRPGDRLKSFKCRGRPGREMRM